MTEETLLTPRCTHYNIRSQLIMRSITKSIRKRNTQNITKAKVNFHENLKVLKVSHASAFECVCAWCQVDY